MSTPYTMQKLRELAGDGIDLLELDDPDLLATIAERDDLRAQLVAVTRERDSWRSQRDEVHAEMERQTQLKREERQAKLDAQRERDEARADAARLREVLELAVREMERASNVGEVRFRTSALASGVHIGLAEALFAARAALASTPSAEPTPRDMRDEKLPLPTGPRPDPEPSERMLRVAVEVARYCLAEGEELNDADRSALRAIVAKAVKP